MRRRISSAFLALAMVLSLLSLPALAAEQAPFSDVTDHWGKASVERWAGYGVLNGDPAGNFNPDAQMTRAEFATMLVNMLGYTEKAENTFADVPADAWFADAVLKLAAAGVMKGDGTNANPNAPISRQEAVVLLCRAFNIAPSKDAKIDFADGEAVADWASDAVAALTERGMIAGVGENNFAPVANITRASVAKLADNMVAEYVTADKEITGEVKGLVVVAGAAEVTLKDAKLAENLIVAPKAGEAEVTLTGKTTAGNIYVQSDASAVKVEKGATAASVLVDASKASVEVAGKVESIMTTETAAEAAVTVAKGATVDAVALAGEDAKLDVTGTVKDVEVSSTAKGADIVANQGAKITNVTTSAEDVKVSGKGTVSNVTANAGSADVTTKGTKVTNDGADKVTANGKEVADGKTSTTPGGSTGGGGSYTPSTPTLSGYSPANLHDTRNEFVSDDPEEQAYIRSIAKADDQLVKGYSVTATEAKDNGLDYVKLAVKGSSLAFHWNAAPVDKEGFWIGAAIPVPAGADPTHTQIAFNEWGWIDPEDTGSEEWQDLDAWDDVRGQSGDFVAVYGNLAHAQPKDHVTILWADSEGRALDTAPRNYLLDYSGVSLLSSQHLLGSVKGVEFKKETDPASPYDLLWISYDRLQTVYDVRLEVWMEGVDDKPIFHDGFQRSPDWTDETLPANPSAAFTWSLRQNPPVGEPWYDHYSPIGADAEAIERANDKIVPAGSVLHFIVTAIGDECFQQIGFTYTVQPEDIAKVWFESDPEHPTAPTDHPETFEALKESLKYFKEITLDESITIGEAITIPADVLLTVNAPLTVNAQVTLNGTMDVRASVGGTGNVDMAADMATIWNYAAFDCPLTMSADVQFYHYASWADGSWTFPTAPTVSTHSDGVFFYSFRSEPGEPMTKVQFEAAVGKANSLTELRGFELCSIELRSGYTIGAGETVELNHRDLITVINGTLTIRGTLAANVDVVWDLSGQIDVPDGGDWLLPLPTFDLSGDPTSLSEAVGTVKDTWYNKEKGTDLSTVPGYDSGVAAWMSGFETGRDLTGYDRLSVNGEEAVAEAEISFGKGNFLTLPIYGLDGDLLKLSLPLLILENTDSGKLVFRLDGPDQQPLQMTILMPQAKAIDGSTARYSYSGGAANDDVATLTKEGETYTLTPKQHIGPMWTGGNDTVELSLGFTKDDRDVVTGDTVFFTKKLTEKSDGSYGLAYGFTGSDAVAGGRYLVFYPTLKGSGYEIVYTVATADQYGPHTLTLNIGANVPEEAPGGGELEPPAGLAVQAHTDEAFPPKIVWDEVADAARYVIRFYDSNGNQLDANYYTSDLDMWLNLPIEESYTIKKITVAAIDADKVEGTPSNLDCTIDCTATPAGDAFRDISAVYAASDGTLTISGLTEGKYYWFDISATIDHAELSCGFSVFSHQGDGIYEESLDHWSTEELSMLTDPSAKIVFYRLDDITVASTTEASFTMVTGTLTLDTETPS